MVESAATNKKTKDLPTRSIKECVTCHNISIIPENTKGCSVSCQLYSAQKSISENINNLLKSDRGAKALHLKFSTGEKKYGLKTPPIGSRTGFYKKGFAKDLGVSMRSGWEKNFARYLNAEKIIWEFEPKLFIFDGVKKGNLSYLPDFYLPKDDIWIEVKGFLRPQDKIKIRRFQRFFPEEFKKLQVVINSKNSKVYEFYHNMGIKVFVFYGDLKKQKNAIPGWED